MIKCKDPTCDQFMTSPCGDVISLFGFKQFLQEVDAHVSQTGNTQLQQQTQAQLQQVNDKIAGYFKEDAETQFQQFTMNAGSNTGALSITKEVVMECTKKHRHTYTIECTP